MKNVFLFLAAALFCYGQSANAQATSNTNLPSIAPVPTESTPGADSGLVQSPAAATGSNAMESQSQATQGNTPSKMPTKKWTEMTPKEREEIREKFKEAWEKLTPEQKEEVNNQIREKLKELTPEQRQNVIRGLETYWKSLSQEEKESIIAKSGKAPPMKTPKGAPAGTPTPVTIPSKGEPEPKE